MKLNNNRRDVFRLQNDEESVNVQNNFNGPLKVQEIKNPNIFFKHLNAKNNPNSRIINNNGAHMSKLRFLSSNNIG